MTAVRYPPERDAVEVLRFVADWVDLAEDVIRQATGRPLDDDGHVQADLRALADRAASAPAVEEFLSAALPPTENGAR